MSETPSTWTPLRKARWGIALAAGLIALAALAVSDSKGWQRLVVLPVAACVTLWFAQPALGEGAGSRKARGSLGFITEHWQPAGEDQLSRLKRLPQASRPPNWEQEVVHLHRELGQRKALRKWQRARRKSALKAR